MSDGLDALLPPDDDEVDASLLELVDHLLDKGVVVTGEAIIGLCDVDLVYLRLSVVLAAADRIFPRGEE